MNPSLGAQRADERLLSAYPDERQRARAARWLGWIAEQTGAGQRWNWWTLPAWVPLPQLQAARSLAMCVAWAVLAGLATAVTPWAVIYLAVLPVSGLYVLIMIPLTPRRRRSALPPGEPDAVVPRWPRPGELLVLLVRVIPFVAPAFAGLVRLWIVPALGRPGATALGTYRADRLASVVTAVSWLPLVALLVAPLYVLAGLPRMLIVMSLIALASGAFFGLTIASRYVWLKLAELVLAAEWRDRVSFMWLLEDAVGRGVVRRVGASYEFTDDALRERLAAFWREALAGHQAQQARRAARPGPLMKIVGKLTADVIARASIPIGVGVGIFVATAGGMALQSEGGLDAGPAFGLALMAAVAGFAAFRLLAVWLRGLAATARWTRAHVPAASRRSRLAATAAAVAAAAVMIGEFGTALATAVAYALPATFVAACGTWLWALARGKRRAVRPGRLRACLFLAGSVTIVATTAMSLLLLVHRALLATQPAAGLLFPLAVWGGLRTWRAMRASGRCAVRAAADITLSLVLGAEMVLFLVWLANLLDLASPEMAALRAFVSRIGSIANLPWWAWTGLYVLLATLGVGFVVRPARLAKAESWLRRLRVLPATDAARRVLTCVHIGLMVIVLVGLAGPVPLIPALQRQLKVAYTVAFQRQLDAVGELAAYQRIRAQFSAAAAGPVLTGLVVDIHDTSPPPPGDDNATTTETDLALRLGELQAAALKIKAVASLLAAANTAATEAGLDAPVHDETSLADAVAETDAEQQKDDAGGERAEQAADLAAKVLASGISAANIGGNEVFEIVREYLTGLIEESPLKNFFAAWAAHLGGRQAPPDAETTVVPNPERLEHAASAVLSQEFTTEGMPDPITDPILADDRAYNRALREAPLDAAVDLANQARYLQEGGGPCSGCTRPENSEENPGEPEEGHEAP